MPKPTNWREFNPPITRTRVPPFRRYAGGERNKDITSLQPTEEQRRRRLARAKVDLLGDLEELGEQLMEVWDD